MSSTETFKKAFDHPPSEKVSGTAEVGTLVSPYISYGLPYTEAAAKHVTETFKASRAYIIASRTLARETDHLERLIAALEEKNVQVVGVKKGMRPHTPWSQIIEIANEARELKVDVLITLGAGSLTDGAKIIVMALANDITDPRALADYSIEAKEQKSGLNSATVPVISIPTSLSGGEYFSHAGGTDDLTGHKQGFMQNGMGISLILLDAELSVGTPWVHWGPSGVRSVDHCIEALCCLESTPESDESAEAGLRLLVPSLLKSKIDNGDVEARHKSQLGVRYSMQNVRDGIPLGGSHAIGHHLGPMGVAHGVTSCVMCPAVMKWNIEHGKDIPEIQKKQAKIRSILWSIPDVAERFKKDGLTEEKADLGDLLDVFIRALGLPRTLKEVGIGPEHIDALSERTLADFWAPTNPIPLVKASQVKSILEMVVG